MTNLDIEVMLEQEEQKLFDILEDFEGDGYYAVQIPEFTFPVDAYVFVDLNGGVFIDERKPFKVIKKHRLTKCTTI